MSDDLQDIKARIDERNKLLRAAGCTDAVTLGGTFFVPEATTCLSCGAMILLPQYHEDPETHPLTVHARWHEKFGGLLHPTPESE